MADAGYITYNQYIKPQGEVLCGPGFDCNTVLSSDFAHLGPMPISALGFAFYLSVFVVGILHFLEFDIRPIANTISNKLKLNKNNPFRFASIYELLVVLSVAGALFSLYLLMVMNFILEAWCQFCIISACTSISLFIITLFYTHYIKDSPFFVIKSLIFKVLGFLYTHVLRLILFFIDPETAHNLFTKIGGILGSFSCGRKLTSSLFSSNHQANAKTIAGITFPNIVGLAAGFDYDGKMANIIPAVGFGWHTIGTVTLEAYEGNAPPRLQRLPKSYALIVNKGLKSIGAREVIKQLEGKVFEVPVGISIASTNKHFTSTKAQIIDILMTFQLFESSRVRHHYYELNISCPNTFGGEPFTTPARLEILLKALESLHLSRPVFVKMPIDQSEKETLALLAVLNKSTAVQGIIIGNLTKNKKNPALTQADRETWAKSRGNVSGKPTWKLSNHLIKLARKRYKKRFIIIGTGGIFSAQDAEEKIRCGADLVQLITGMIYQGPALIGEINLLQAKNHLRL